MKTPNDLWEEMGDLPPEDLLHVMTTLFAIYEEKLERPHDLAEGSRFFGHLDAAITQACQCNSSRR